MDRSQGRAKSLCNTLLWVTDPWDTLDHGRDTTLRLAQEAQRMNYDNYWCDSRTIRYVNGGYLVETFSLSFDADTHRTFVGSKDVEFFSSIFYRTDPPVDLRYLHPLQLLWFAQNQSHKRFRILNSPSAIIGICEKLEGAMFPGLMPPTIVCSQRDPLQQFGRKLGMTVLKPLNQSASRGVELLNWSSPRDARLSLEILEKATLGFSTPILLQKFIPQVTRGETRLWFANGSLIGAVKRFPMKGDFRINSDVNCELETSSIIGASKGHRESDWKTFEDQWSLSCGG